MGIKLKIDPNNHINNQSVSLETGRLVKKLFKLSAIKKGINKSIDDTKRDILVNTSPFTKLKVGKYMLSYQKASITNKINTDLLKTKYPDIYKECLLSKPKSDSLTISKI